VQDEKQLPIARKAGRVRAKISGRDAYSTRAHVAKGNPASEAASWTSWPVAGGFPGP
jgi:hypothetical protein